MQAVASVEGDILHALSGMDPTERLFEELRAALANRVFDDLDALDQALTRGLASILG